jgi:hypothetical protein
MNTPLGNSVPALGYVRIYCILGGCHAYALTLE